MTSTRRAAMRRMMRSLDSLGLTERQESLLRELSALPPRTPSPAAKLDPWSPPVMQTLRQFIDDTGLVAEYDHVLHHHPGPRSEISPDALMLLWLMANWKERTFRRTSLSGSVPHLPDEVAKELGLKDAKGIWNVPGYTTFQKQETRLEKKMRERAVSQDEFEVAWIKASLRGADLDAIQAGAVDTTAVDGWHLARRFDEQKALNKQIRAHYRQTTGRSAAAAQLPMSSPEMIATARELGIPLGEDGRLQRSDDDTDLRGGRMSGTNRRNARDFSGYEATKCTATRTHTYNRKTGTVELGPAVHPYVLASHLAPANTDVGPISATGVRRARGNAKNLTHVFADGGITQKTDSFSMKVAELGIDLHQGFDKPHVERGAKPMQITAGKKKHTVMVHCGELFHINTPKNCLTPPEGYFALDEKPPKDGETDEEREAREERNAQRAEMRAEWLTERRRWKYDIHRRFDDGRLQFICPFHAGKLWCNEVPPSPKLRDGAEFVVLPAGTTKCCNGTFIASLADLVRIGHQEPAYLSLEHIKVYAQRIPVEGRFGTDQENGAYAPRSCRAARLEPHAIASLIFDAIGNLQITMNKEIDELRDRRALRTHRQLPRPHQQRAHREPVRRRRRARQRTRRR